jgi:hypothetical protein
MDASTVLDATSAGYLEPDDLEAASSVVPAMGDLIRKLEFRESLPAMGLLQARGHPAPERAGAAAQRNPAKPWSHLAERLIPAKAG